MTLRMGRPGDFDFSAEIAGVTLEDELRRAVGTGATVIQVSKTLGTSKWIAKKRLDAAGYETYKRGPKSSVWVVPKDNGDQSTYVD